MTIIAPQGGYSFGNKKQYRRDVWAAARRFVQYNRKAVNVALMPSLRGDEIKTCLAAGFHEGRISIIDKSPAVVASVKRRFPLVECYGVDVVAAFERMARARKMITFANLDLCCNVKSAVTILKKIAALECWADPHAVAVTIFRGRESHLMQFADRYIAQMGITTYGECNHGDDCLCTGEKVETMAQYLASMDEDDPRPSVLSILDLARAELLFGAFESVSFGGATASRERIYRSSSGNTMMWRVVARSNGNLMKLGV